MPAALAALLIGLAASDSAPIRPIAQWVHTKWSVRDGAPAGIYAFAQTPDGTLWIGGRGLVRFDGIRFVTVVPQGGDSVPAGSVDGLLASRDGSLWILWSTGIVGRLREGRLVFWTPKDGLPWAWAITESRTGALVAATSSGLVSFDDGAWKDVSREWGYPAKAAKAAWFDRGDTLWVLTEDRVVYRPPGAPRFIDPGMITLRPGDLTAFAQAKDGTVWMAELARSVHTVPRLGDRQPLTEVAVGALGLLFDRRGSLWIATGGDGLRRVKDPAQIRGRKVARLGPEAEQFTERDGLQSDIVFSIFEDRESNIWVGTSRGLERFRESAFAPIPTPGSVRPRMVYATRDTMLWVIALNTGNFFRIGPRRRDTVDTPLFFPINFFEDPSGVAWTVHGGAILRYQQGRFAPIPLSRSKATQLVNLTADTAGSLWVTDAMLGVFRLHRDSLIPVKAPDGSSPGGTLFGDRNGRVWLAPGRNNMAVLFEHGALRASFDREHGTGPEHVWGFFQDRAGTIWAYGPDGLSRFEGRGFRTQTARQGIPSRGVRDIAEDAEGAWWMAVRGGIVRVPAGEFDRALSDTAYAVQYRRFDRLDGLPGDVSEASPGPIVTRTADGRIWVATDSGVAVVDPRYLARADPPAARIEAARISGRELLPKDALTIPPRPRDLEIDYTAATLSIPERVQFRYRLEGEDDSWREVGTRRRAYYTGLGPGSYHFRVSASNGDGVWSDSVAVWSFRVNPAWYQTLWFRGAGVLLIGGIGGLAAVTVQRRRHHRDQLALKARYEATLAERARIAQDLHDSLLQGFAGVALQLKAAERALPDQPDVAAETLSKVQHLARASLREARERVWDMRETELGSTDLPAALEAVARERCAGTGIDIAVVTAGQRRRLTRALEDAAFRTGREAVVNAVRHSGCRRIEILTRFDPKLLRLEVTDDGRGFTPDRAEDAGRNGHFGLSGIRERAAHMGGRCEVRARPGGGTMLVLELPLPE